LYHHFFLVNPIRPGGDSGTNRAFQIIIAMITGKSTSRPIPACYWNIGDVSDWPSVGGHGDADPFFITLELGIAFSDSGPQPPPEPASIVMLRAGLVGVRQVRRAVA